MQQLKIGVSITNRKEHGLDLYLSDISKMPLISAEEEAELARRIRQNDDAALTALINANLRFVVSVAKQYQNQGLCLSDLINEGNVGLITAAKKFDETRGFKFISYAVWWIRQSIMQALAEKSRIVRLPVNQVGFITKINKAVSLLEQKYNRKPSTEEIAKAMDVEIGKIIEATRSNGKPLSIDAPFSEDDEGSLGDIIPNTNTADTDQGLTDASLNEEINRSLATLSEKESEIIKMFFGIGYHEMTLEEIGDKFELTRERVRQIKDNGLKKLRKNPNSDSLRSYLCS